MVCPEEAPLWYCLSHGLACPAAGKDEQVFYKKGVAEVQINSKSALRLQ
jgi:hypothetical protein